MGGLFGTAKQPQTAQQPQAAAGVKVQTSVNGKVIPLAYGRCKLAANIVWFDFFKAIPHQKQNNTAAGASKGGSGSGGCFAPEMRVLTPDRGLVPIIDLQIGDKVWSYDYEAGENIIGTVTRTWKHDVANETHDKMLLLYLDGGIKLHLTTDHYMWSDGNKKIQAQEFLGPIKDKLRDFNGDHPRVFAGDFAPDIEFTYNLTIEPFHNFFVEGILVHNGGSSSANKSTTEYTYQASIIFGLCEGPCYGGLLNIWENQTVKTAAALGIGFIYGDFGTVQVQPNIYPTGYINGKFAAQLAQPAASVSSIITYSGIAYAYAAPYDMGSTAQLPNLNFEINGFYYGGGGNAGGDAKAMEVVVDLLSNSHHGAGFPSNQLGELLVSVESFTIPTVTFRVTVAQASKFGYALSVNDISGNFFVIVPSAPKKGQFSVNAGVFQFNSADVNTQIVINYVYNIGFATYNNWCQSSSLWISPLYDAQTTASSILNDIAKFTYSDFVWSAGCLKLVPRSAVQTVGNGVTYNPPSAPVYSVTEDDFVAPGGKGGASGQDPIVVTRKRAADQNNVVQLEWLDRNNQYAPAVAEVTDQGLLDRFGRRTSGSMQAHIFCESNAAHKSAWLMLMREHVRNTYAFTLDPRFAALDPGDIINVTDTIMGIVNQSVFITDVTENDDGSIAIVAEEWPINLGKPPLHQISTSNGYAPNYEVDPGPCLETVAFVVPWKLTQSLYVWLATTGGDLWGGASLYISYDDVTYQFLQDVKTPSRVGVLTAPLSEIPAAASGTTIDSSGVLAIQLVGSNAELSPATVADAQALNTLCYVDGELMAYANATLTGTGKYNLTYLVRGAYGTTIKAHAIGSKFVRLDSSILKIPFTPDRIGQIFFYKLLPYNLWGGGKYSISTVSSSSIALTGPTIPGQVTNFSVIQVGSSVVFTWDEVLSPVLEGYNISYSARGGTYSSSVFLTHKSAGTEMTNAGVPPGDWTFWIIAIDSLGFSSTPTSADLTVSRQLNPIVFGTPFDPGWAGTLTGCFAHPSGSLVPQGTLAPSSYGALTSLFGCPNPIATSSFVSPTIDTGYTSTLRVIFTDTLALLPGQSGSPAVTTAIDYWNAGALWQASGDPRTGASINGTMDPPTNVIVDNSGHVYDVVNNQVYVDGALAGTTSSVSYILWYNSTLYYVTIGGSWFSWNGSTWSSVPSGDPRTITSSPDGAVIMGQAGEFLVDVAGGVWTILSSQIWLNGALAGTTSNAVIAVLHNNVVYYGNVSNSWFSWNGTTWISAAGDPRSGGTPTPAVSGVVIARQATSKAVLTGVAAGSINAISGGARAAIAGSVVSSIFRVQGATSANINTTSSTSIGATLSNTVGSGNAVMGAVTWGANSAALTSVTDDKGNSYTVVNNSYDSSHVQSFATFYRLNITNAPVTITANFGSSVAWRNIIVDEFSGIATSSALDGNAMNLQSTTSNVTDMMTSTNITTTANGDLIYGVNGSTGAGTVTSVGTGYTAAAVSADTYYRAEYKVQTSAGSIAATFTHTGTNSVLTGIMAFKHA